MVVQNYGLQMAIPERKRREKICLDGDKETEKVKKDRTKLA